MKYFGFNPNYINPNDISQNRTMVGFNPSFLDPFPDQFESISFGSISIRVRISATSVADLDL